MSPHPSPPSYTLFTLVKRTLGIVSKENRNHQKLAWVDLKEAIPGVAVLIECQLGRKKKQSIFCSIF